MGTSRSLGGGGGGSEGDLVLAAEEHCDFILISGFSDEVFLVFVSDEGFHFFSRHFFQQLL